MDVSLLKSQLAILGWSHLQPTHSAVAFAPWDFLIVFKFKNKKIPMNKCHGYMRMLQMNPP